MKNLRVLLFLSLALSFSCVHTGTMKWTKSIPNILADAKESIFLVVSMGNGKSGAGNAYMIDPGVLMTAGHVCHGDVGAMVFVNTDQKTYGGTIAFKSEPDDGDACIIESDVPGKPLAMLAECDNYDKAYALSYTTHGLGPPQLKMFIREARVRNELPFPSENPPDGIGKRLFLDGQFQQGDSGSPLFNNDGFVIGHISAGLPDPEAPSRSNGITIAIDARTLYAVRQQYAEEKKSRVPVPLPLPPPPMNVVKFPGENKK